MPGIMNGQSGNCGGGGVISCQSSGGSLTMGECGNSDSVPSNSGAISPSPSEKSSCKSLEDVLYVLAKRATLLNDETHCNVINVIRENVLDGGY